MADFSGDVSSITITLSDGATRQVPHGATIKQIATNIGKRLGRDAIGGVVAGDTVIDVHTPLLADTHLRIITVGTEEGLEVLRHSTAHLLASAVVKLFPGTQVTIGPAIETGFYYDFARQEGFGTDELELIEQEMRKIAAQDQEFTREVVTRQQAKALFKELGETYKLELIDAIAENDTITLYRHGDWVDLCRGPHVPSTKHLRHFRLTHVAGAYWRGDETKPMLARVYGTAFWKQEELDAHFAALDEAKRRDHRKLGRDLDLFSFHAVAPAMPFFHGRGTKLYNLLANWMRRYYDVLGFDEVITPQVVDTELFAQSGHLGNYRENMYFVDVDERKFGLKPMNCPGHTLIFADRNRSYRDLPIRMADFGRLHRYERSGTTAGLTRVRAFSQDDAHIFCREDQVGFEIETQIMMLREVLEHFGFAMQVMFSTRPEHSLGREAELSSQQRSEWDNLWEHAETTLEAAIRAAGMPYRRNEGDGAFYGPKIDVQVKDALGRWHQLGTIQLDFALPKRFNLTYTAKDGTAARPVMVHRAVLGSLERFMGILIEHTAGDFPVWLAPVQVMVVTVNDRLLGYGRQVHDALVLAGLRVELDTRSEKLGAKIRDAELSKIPVVAVLGPKEEQASTVSLRWRKKGEDHALSLDQAVRAVLDAATAPSPGDDLVRRMAEAWNDRYLREA